MLRSRRNSKAAPHSLSPFPFRSLPPELRLKVYEFTLATPKGARLRRRTFGPFSSRGWYKWEHDTSAITGGRLCRPTVALLATCKMIEREALHVLYSQPLHFADVRTARHFLPSLRPTTLALLRDVTLSSWNLGRGCLTRSVWNSIIIIHLCHVGKIRRLRIGGKIVPGGDQASRDGDMAWRRAHCGQPWGQLLAEGLYQEWSPFLRAMAYERGVDAVLRTLDLGDDCFYDRFCGPYTYDNSGRRKRQPAVRPPLGQLSAQRGIFENELRRLLQKDGQAAPSASQITP